MAAAPKTRATFEFGGRVFNCFARRVRSKGKHRTIRAYCAIKTEPKASKWAKAKAERASPAVIHLGPSFSPPTIRGGTSPLAQLKRMSAEERLALLKRKLITPSQFMAAASGGSGLFGLRSKRRRSRRRSRR